MTVSGFYLLGRKVDSADLTRWQSTCTPRIPNTLVSPNTILHTVERSMLAPSTCDCKKKCLTQNN